MRKYFLLFFILTFIYQLHADSLSSLTTFKDSLTHYYHKLLSNIDDTMPCEHNCTHKERQEIKHNTLQLVTSFKSSKDKPMQISLNLRGHIHLPKISKKLELTFSKQSNDLENNKQVDYENENLITDDKVRIGLRYYFIKKDEYRFYTKLGFKIHSPFGFYQQLSLEKDFYLVSDAYAKTQISLYYFINQIYFAKAAKLIFYKPLNDTFLLEQRNDIYTNHDNQQITHIEHYLKLHHKYNHKNIFSYWLTYATADRANKHFFKNWQGVSISYIHYLRKWLYLDTSPRIFQRRERHFKNEFALTLNVGIKLGL